jgi:hypothetical protein
LPARAGVHERAQELREEAKPCASASIVPVVRQFRRRFPNSGFGVETRIALKSEQAAAYIALIRRQQSEKSYGVASGS